MANPYETSEGRLARLQSEKDFAEEEALRAMEAYEDVQRQIRSLETELQAACEQIAVANELTRQTLERAEVEKAQTEETRASLTKLEADYARLNTAYHNLGDECRLRITEGAELKRALERAQRSDGAELAEARAKLELRTKELEQVRGAQTKLKAERLALMTQQSQREISLQRESSALRSDLEKAREEGRKAKDALAALQADMLRTEGDSEAMRASYQQLQQELNDARLVPEGLKSQLAAAEQELQRTAQEARTLNEQRADLELRSRMDGEAVLNALQAYTRSLGVALGRPIDPAASPGSHESSGLPALEAALGTRIQLLTQVEDRLAGTYAMTVESQREIDRLDLEAQLEPKESFELGKKRRKVVSVLERWKTYQNTLLLPLQAHLKEGVTVLRRHVEATKLLEAGLPTEYLSGALPLLPEWPDPIEEPHQNEGSEPVPAHERLSAKHGLSPLAVIVASLVEVIPKEPKRASLRRIMEAAEKAGILTAYGIANVIVHKLEWIGSPEQQERMEKLIAFGGTFPQGIAQYMRTKDPLPWSVQEVLSEEQIQAFSEAFELVRNKVVEDRRGSRSKK